MDCRRRWRDGWLLETSQEARITRGSASLSLDPLELAFSQFLATARAQDVDRPETVRGFVKSAKLVHLVPAVADLAVPMVRQLARRLERKLAALGEPPVLETCERRARPLRT